MARQRRRSRAWVDPEVDELATAINEFLARFEDDPKINTREEMIWGMQAAFENASAKPLDEVPIIGVRYLGWGPRYLLTKDHAKKYLGRLKRGFTGRHDE